MSLPSSVHAEKRTKLFAGFVALVLITPINLVTAKRSTKFIRRAGPNIALRLTAIFLILGFILPGVFIGSTNKTRANGISIQPPAPVSAPPETFGVKVH